MNLCGMVVGFFWRVYAGEGVAGGGEAEGKACEGR